MLLVRRCVGLISSCYLLAKFSFVGQQDSNLSPLIVTLLKFLACHYLGSTDKRYKQAVDDLNNEYRMGLVKYPESVPDMLHMLNNRRGDGNLASKHREAERDGEVLSSFNQQASCIRCWKCGESGHAKSQCPLLTAKQKKESEER